MYISYSGWKLLQGCIYAYWNRYIGKTEVDAPDDRLGALYGSAIGELFEDFYNKRWWKNNPRPVADMLARVEPTLDRVIKRETSPYRDRKGGVLMWKGDGEGQNPKALYANRQELIEDMRESVGCGCRIIRHYRLLGPYAEAEVKLDWTHKGYRLGGRADFIIKRTKPHNDLCIIDGKGSRWRHKYVDPKQLLWYAMLYRFHHGGIPDKLAFLFWRYDPPESMDWVEFVESDLDELLEDVLTDLRRVETLSTKLIVPISYAKARRVFRPVAESGRKGDAENACRFCPYATPEICPKGHVVFQKLQQPRG